MASEPSEEKVPVVAFKKRGGRPKGSIIRKRPASPKPADSSSDDSSSDDGVQGHRAKRRAKTAAVTATSSSNKTSSTKEIFATTFEADRKATLAASDDATKRVDWAEGEKPKIGPAKTSANVRVTIATDFAPDVCKDYKKTGFCGYGDNCIYAHVREDFQAGWQLDHEWDKVNRAGGGKNPKGTTVASANRDGKTGKGEEEDDEEFLEKIPFACIICEAAYRQPVVTRCGHYFCEPCALKRYRKDPTCAACSAGTNGVFNSAAKLNKLLERKRERAKKAEEAAEGAEKA